jgi:glycosidase
LDVSPTLSFLVDCFKYWIAITVCDGFRIDTVKHISLEEARNFCGAIREFADSLGKRNFLIVGEIAGGDVVVSAELCSPGTAFTVVENTSHTAAGNSFTGSHPVGSTVIVKGRSDEQAPAFIQVRDVQPAEVIIFVKKY